MLGGVPRKQANNIDGMVGNRVRQRRAVLGMSQERLGNLLGLTFQQIQKYEKGVNRIGAGRLFHISEILEVPLTYFYQDVLSSRADHKVGFAEDSAPALSPPKLLTGETMQLTSGFTKIGDTKIRKRLLELVRALAENNKPSV